MKVMIGGDAVVETISVMVCCCLGVVQGTMAFAENLHSEMINSIDVL